MSKNNVSPIIVVVTAIASIVVAALAMAIILLFPFAFIRLKRKPASVIYDEVNENSPTYLRIEDSDRFLIASKASAV